MLLSIYICVVSRPVSQSKFKEKTGKGMIKQLNRIPRFNTYVVSKTLLILEGLGCCELNQNMGLGA